MKSKTNVQPPLFFLMMSLFLPVFLTQCHTIATTHYWNVPVTEEDIDFITIRITKASGVVQEESALEPNGQYIIKAEIYTNDGFIITEPNHHNLSIESPPAVFSSIKKTSEYIMVKMSSRTFPALLDNGYRFVVKVDSNPFAGQGFHYPLSMENYHTLDFSGQDGDSGINGYLRLTDTDNPRDGEDGKDGEPAEDRHLAVFLYRFSNDSLYDQEMICVFDCDNKESYLMPKATITIDLTGGDGGNGGNGYSRDGKFSEGGLGGRGAAGGDLYLYIMDRELLHYIQYFGQGGADGHEGQNAREEDSIPQSMSIVEYLFSGKSRNTDEALRSGDDGYNGSFSVLDISYEDLLFMLKGAHPSFDSARIVREK